MPDLAQTNDEIELPFWIYQPGQPRQRLTIQVSGKKTLLLNADTQSSALSPEHAIDITAGLGPAPAAGWQIRPSAPSRLPVYVLAFSLADFFIHAASAVLFTTRSPMAFCRKSPATSHLTIVSLPRGSCPFPPGTQQRPNPLRSRTHQRHHLVHNPHLAMDRFTSPRGTTSKSYSPAADAALGGNACRQIPRPSRAAAARPSAISTISTQPSTPRRLDPSPAGRRRNRPLP